MQMAYLHVGMPKTGTSTLQSFLLRHRDWLAKKGYYVPRSGQNSQTGAHYGLVRALAGLPLDESQHGLIEWLGRELHAASSPNCIISSEALTKILRAPGMIERFVSVFRRLNHDLTIVLYVRHATEYVNSAYAQRVKSFYERIGVDEFIFRFEERNKRRPIFSVLQKDRTVKTIIQPYNNATRATGIVASFLKEFDLESPATKIEQRENMMPGPIVIDVARCLATILAERNIEPTPQQRVRFMKYVLDEVGNSVKEQERYCCLNEERRDRINIFNIGLRDEFAQEQWGKRWNDFFYEDVNKTYVSNDLSDLDKRPEIVPKLIDRAMRKWDEIAQDEKIAVMPNYPVDLHEAMLAAGYDTSFLGERY